MSPSTEYINDAQIAEKLGISRTPVREAFQRLEKEGLLVNEARKGWRVYMLDLEDIQEIFELKIAIEGMVVRKAAECVDPGLRGDLALAEMKDAVRDDDPDAWLQADIHLHNVLDGDAARAEGLLREHLARVRDDLIQLVASASYCPSAQAGFEQGVTAGPIAIACGACVEDIDWISTARFMGRGPGRSYRTRRHRH